MSHAIKHQIHSVRRRAVTLVKFGKNLSQNFLNSYLLNKVVEGKIHNDLGASFTHTARKKDRIVKTAKPQGESKLRDEINWYLFMADNKFSRHLPKIYDYSLERGKVFLEMKYYAYPNLRKIIYNDMNTKFFIKMRFKHLLDKLLENLYTEKNSVKAPDDFVQKTHFAKLKNRLRETLKMAPFLRTLLLSEYVTINGKRCINLPLIIPAIERNKEIRTLLKPARVYYSHGDLHSNNILCGILHTNFVLIDCRGRSPYGNIYFDAAYDIAKLYHDFHSFYSLIENHNYSVSLHDNGKAPVIEYHFTNDAVKARFAYWGKYLDTLIRNRFQKFGNLEYRAEFTEALLYLTMVPFHLKTESEGLMCYVTGILRLNEWLARHHEDVYKRLIKKEKRGKQ